MTRSASVRPTCALFAIWAIVALVAIAIGVFTTAPGQPSRGLILHLAGVIVAFSFGNHVNLLPEAFGGFASMTSLPLVLVPAVFVPAFALLHLAAWESARARGILRRRAEGPRNRASSGSYGRRIAARSSWWRAPSLNRDFELRLRALGSRVCRSRTGDRKRPNGRQGPVSRAN